MKQESVLMTSQEKSGLKEVPESDGFYNNQFENTFTADDN